MIKKLIELGLTEKQAKAYLALLELWLEKSSVIANKAEIKRTTIYQILDELFFMWIISYTTKWKIKYYKALNPQKLVSLMQSKKEKAINLVPKLENLLNLSSYNKPKISFFSWVEGVKNIYEDTLMNNKNKKIYQIINVNAVGKFIWKDFLKKYIEKRVNLGITAYAIHPIVWDIQNNIYWKNSNELKRIVRYADPKIFGSSIIMIYNNKVAVVSNTKENSWFLIESLDFVKSQKAFFDFIWEDSNKNSAI